MRIATWNVERLKHHAKTDVMLQAVEAANADILVLTETDSRFVPVYPYECHSSLLREIRPDYYRETENRVSIYSRFPVIKKYKTNDMYTCVCVELLTDRGNLLVYGTIMGIFGNREASFNSDLEMQMSDIRRLSMEGHSLCVVGDFNLSFADNYYYTHLFGFLGRQSNNQIRVKDLEQVFDSFSAV